MGPNILARAIVDPGSFRVAPYEQAFVVTVSGRVRGGPLLPNRRYEIAAPTDDDAAGAAITRYVAEMERIN